MVALDDDFARLRRTADAAPGFQHARQLLKVGISAHETFDEGHDLARPLFAVEPHAQVLLPRRQRLGFGFVVRFVVETRVGRIDHPEP